LGVERVTPGREAIDVPAVERRRRDRSRAKVAKGQAGRVREEGIARRPRMRALVRVPAKVGTTFLLVFGERWG